MGVLAIPARSLLKPSHPDIPTQGISQGITSMDPDQVVDGLSRSIVLNGPRGHCQQPPFTSLQILYEYYSANQGTVSEHMSLGRSMRQRLPSKGHVGLFCWITILSSRVGGYLRYVSYAEFILEPCTKKEKTENEKIAPWG